MENVFDFNNVCMDSAVEKSLGQIEICKNTLFYKPIYSLPLVEVNDDLFISESQNSFWSTVEYELKIDIEECNAFDILEGIKCILEENYTISKISFQKSYETHCEVIKKTSISHCVKLGKKNWKMKKAIKVKTVYDDLGRQVSIVPYSESNWNAILQDAIQIKQYPSFYKDKCRYILVNKHIGSVFGVSSSATNFLAKKAPNKYEIEIEYWSNLLPLDARHRFDEENRKELYSIAHIITDYLLSNNIKHSFPGVRKIEWLRSIHFK